MCSIAHCHRIASASSPDLNPWNLAIAICYSYTPFIYSLAPSFSQLIGPIVLLPFRLAEFWVKALSNLRENMEFFTSAMYPGHYSLSLQLLCEYISGKLMSRLLQDGMNERVKTWDFQFISTTTLGLLIEEGKIPLGIIGLVMRSIDDEVERVERIRKNLVKSCFSLYSNFNSNSS